MARHPRGESFTLRGVIAGLAIGTVICSANVYFGLQTGWVSIMSMPASLMGFGIFRLLRNHIELPFSPVENVFVQSVACGMAIMPLGCGFVGVVRNTTEKQNDKVADMQTDTRHELPSRAKGNGPDQVIYMADDCLVARSVLLWSRFRRASVSAQQYRIENTAANHARSRRQVIIKERLKFPSGFSTAVLISVLHEDGNSKSRNRLGEATSKQRLDEASKGGFASLVPHDEDPDEELDISNTGENESSENAVGGAQWASNLRLLIVCFAISGTTTLMTYFLPFLNDVPIFGTVAASQWLWTFNPSLAYVGQGIIMGTETTMHMLLGAVVGWAILSPLAKYRGWAPGEVDDWEHGSKGWIIWISLAIMLADAIVSLGYIALLPVFRNPAVCDAASKIADFVEAKTGWSLGGRSHRYAPILARNGLDDEDSDDEDQPLRQPVADAADDGPEDAPVQQRIGSKTVVGGLLASVVICVAAVHIVFGNLVPIYATIIAVFMALILSIMGVRALGETDLNPVSGISKLAQLFFAFIIPQSNKSSVLINLIAGAISEAGALQAGDLMQDLKTGHLLGASPKAQFFGQLIGASCGAVFSVFVYQLYTSTYEIPGKLFQVPTAYVWILTARLVTGQGLPDMAKEWAIGAAVLFALITIVRSVSQGKRWRPLLPGGIAVAVGMYNVPSFTLARAVGGIVAFTWMKLLKRETTPLIILASGFILGEGFLSIVNLLMKAMKVPHL